MAFAALVTILAGVNSVGQSGGGSAVAPATGVVGISPTKASASSIETMTNTAVSTIAKIRNVDPSQVQIRLLTTGPEARFQIGLDGAKDIHAEALALSDQFGSNAVVIVDQATGDGLFRTNWSFRDGQERIIRAPIGKTGLKPGAQRMYVWAETLAKPSEPSGLRVASDVQKTN